MHQLSRHCVAAAGMQVSCYFLPKALPPAVHMYVASEASFAASNITYYAQFTIVYYYYVRKPGPWVQDCVSIRLGFVGMYVSYASIGLFERIAEVYCLPVV